MDKFAERIKELRLNKGISQEQLGIVAGLGKQAVSSWERGESKPRSDVLYSLADFFNCSTDYLLGRTDNPAGTALQDVLPDAIPATGRQAKLPIIRTVKAGPNGIAYEDDLGEEWTDEEDISGGARHYWFQVKGDSMIGEGILPGDLALVREQPDVEYGELAVVVVNGYEGTLKRVYKKAGSIILQSANPAYPPRIFSGQEIDTVKIVGKVKVTKRKY